MTYEGFLLIDKREGMTSFSVIAALRRRLKVKKIGHAGTLDPFATGLLLVFVSRSYTKYVDAFVGHDKEYEAELILGEKRDTFDLEGKLLEKSGYRPSQEEVCEVIDTFQGSIQQIPPMFSAKKVGGKKLYQLARKGVSIERKPVEITLSTTLLDYTYPSLRIHVECSKGTYIRSIGDEIGEKLGSYAYANTLRRTRSGPFHIEESVPLDVILDPETDVESYLRKDIDAYIS